MTRASGSLKLDKEKHKVPHSSDRHKVVCEEASFSLRSKMTCDPEELAPEARQRGDCFAEQMGRNHSKRYPVR